MDVQAFHELGAVGFGSFRTDGQPVGDLASRTPLRDQLQDFALAQSEQVKTGRGLNVLRLIAGKPQIFVKQVARYHWTEPTLASQHRSQRTL